MKYFKFRHALHSEACTIRRNLQSAIAVLVIAMLLCTGCSRQEDSAPDKSELTTDFLEDTVFTVSDMRVGLAEWYLYALPEADKLESMYGKDIWNYPVTKEGKNMRDAFREDIRNQITYVRIVSSRADELGLSLGEDDLFNLNLQTEEYMSRLSKEQAEKYGITRDVVWQVYSDNLLAMKVYENLTLNIDTSIPDELVRHMVLDYITIHKDFEDESGEFVRYSDSEIEKIREDATVFLAEVLENGQITRLSDVNDENYSVIELVTDLDGLHEKLPGDLPEIAFSLRQDEIQGLYETDDAFFILNCVERVEDESTNAARVAIIEARQKELFEEKYEKWENETVIKYNYRIWDGLE